MNTIDPLGMAVADYYAFGKAAKLIVHSDDFDDDQLPVPYLFRQLRQMPAIEQKAIELCTGKVLDVGACAGSHSLELQKKGVDVTALEISQLCCDVMKKRGVEKVVCHDFYTFEGGGFDSVLMMMNGTCMAGTLQNLTVFLQKLKRLLNPGGKVIIDSSDLIYLFQEDDGSCLINLNDKYYGEMQYTLEYKKQLGQPFNCLYVDADTFAVFAENNGFSFDIVVEGNHFDYLAVLQKR